MVAFALHPEVAPPGLRSLARPPATAVAARAAASPHAAAGGLAEGAAEAHPSAFVRGAAAALVASTACAGRRQRRLGKAKHTRRQNAAQPIPTNLDEVEAVAEDGWGERFDWKKAWYPMGVIQDLDPGKPTKMELLGHELVAWKDKEGEWHVFEDRCPHRNVPLSEGRIESDGTLMCSYHGWRFDGDGKISALPQAKEEDLERILSNPRACASARPTRVKQGVLWVWGECSADAALESALQEPILPEEVDDPALEGRVTFGTWSHRDIPYGWEVAMENVTDPGHVDVAHHNIVSNRYEDPTPIKIDFVRKATNKGGFKFTINKLRSDEVKEKKGIKGLVSTMDFKPPHAMHIKSAFPDGTSLTLLINFVPTKPGWTRLVGSTVLVKGPNGEKPPGFSVYSAPLPRWLVHLLAPAFLHQDQVFLHFQQSILQKEMMKTGQTWKESYWIPTEADKGTVTLRRWLDKNGGVEWNPAVPDDLSALPDKSLLFDTYKTHTSQCVTCQKALKRTAVVQKVLKYSAVTLAAAGVSTASWPMLAGSAVLSAGYGAASKLRGMFYEVPFNHQDNN